MKHTFAIGLIRVGALAALLSINPAQATMVGYWNFNEGSGTTVKDCSTKNNSGGTLVAGQGFSPTWTTGHTGLAGDSALQFHGYSDHVTIPVTTALGITSTFTIAMWARADSLGYYPYLIETSNDAAGGSRQWFIQGSNSGSDQMYMYSDADYSWRKALGFKEGGTSTADTVAWHHYAFTYSGGVATPYVDGVAKNTQTISGSAAFPALTNILIGGKGQVWTSWEGPIDDVVIFNSVENVASIMNGTNAEMLAAAVTPYDTWATTKGLTGVSGSGSNTDPAATADPDKDGRTNLEEFGFDGNPLSGKNDGKMVGKVATLPSDSSQVLTLTVPVRNGATFSGATAQVSASVDGIGYTIEGSTTLATASWTAVVSEITGTDATAIQSGLPALSTGWTYRTFRTAGTVPAGGSRGFIRAKVTK